MDAAVKPVSTVNQECMGHYYNYCLALLPAPALRLAGTNSGCVLVILRTG